VTYRFALRKAKPRPVNAAQATRIEAIANVKIVPIFEKAVVIAPVDDATSHIEYCLFIFTKIQRCNKYYPVVSVRPPPTLGGFSFPIGNTLNVVDGNIPNSRINPSGFPSSKKQSKKRALVLPPFFYSLIIKNERKR